jgi:hypothetical protein
MKKEYIDTDEVPQDRFDNLECGGGGNGHEIENESDVKINWWYIGSIILVISIGIALSLIF